MSRKLYAAFLPLLALAAFAVAPAVAQAEPHWYSNGTVIAQGKPEPVKTSGVLVLHALGLEIKCKVKDKETIENPVGGGAGTDLITEFVLSGCKLSPGTVLCHKGETLEVNAGGLPWPTRLFVDSSGIIRDEIAGIELKIECNNKKSKVKTLVDVFKGSLTPSVGKSVLEFGAGSGALEDPSKNQATVTGTDNLTGPPKDTKITAQNP